MGLYPIAYVGGDPYGRYIYMGVRRGYQELVVTVDGCTAQVVRVSRSRPLASVL